jgi:beta-fructofuranosidase
MAAPSPLFGREQAAVSDGAILRAMEALEAAAEKVAGDPTRPVYHFRPPANWMNDACGAIYYKGYYHLFYQLNPYGDVWSEIHWGHAKSRDLVHWEHLPPAVAPMENERRCNSGCVTLNELGQPMIFYTHVPNYDAPRDQRAAMGDKDMITWQRHADNPILHLDTHGGPRFGGDGWDAPFVFREAGRSFMIIGADSLGPDRAVPIYEALNPDFSRWQYKGLLFRASKKSLANLEVPMFCRLGDWWLLAIAPGGPVVYWLGGFDVETLTFTAQPRELLNPSRDFYAPHIFFDNEDRCILVGWTRNFKSGRGWNGCLSLPRVLSLDSAGRLRQRPVPALRKLRKRHAKLQGVTLDKHSPRLEKQVPDTVEIVAVFDPCDAKSFGMKLVGSDETAAIRCGGGTIDVAGVETSLKPAADRDGVALQVYLDRSVLEVFVNDGLQSVSKVVYLGGSELTLELFAEGGGVRVESLDIWRMRPVWKQ